MTRCVALSIDTYSIYTERRFGMKWRYVKWVNAACSLTWHRVKRIIIKLNFYNVTFNIWCALPFLVTFRFYTNSQAVEFVRQREPWVPSSAARRGSSLKRQSRDQWDSTTSLFTRTKTFKDRVKEKTIISFLKEPPAFKQKHKNVHLSILHTVSYFATNHRTEKWLWLCSYVRNTDLKKWSLCGLSWWLLHPCGPHYAGFLISQFETIALWEENKSSSVYTEQIEALSMTPTWRKAGIW